MYRPCVKHRKIWFIWSVVEDNARAYILTSISILCVACGLYVDGLCDGPVSVFLSCLQRVDSSLQSVIRDSGVLSSDGIGIWVFYFQKN